MSFRRNKGLLEQAGEHADHFLESTFVTAKEHAKDAQSKAAPLLATGLDLASERASMLADKAAAARAELADRASEHASTVADRAASARADLADRASQVNVHDHIATLKSNAVDLKDTAAVKAHLKEEPKSGGFFKKLLVLGLLAAIGGVVFKKLRSGEEANAWESAYIPKPPPAAPDTSSDPATDPVDEGGPAVSTATTAPDDAVAERVDESADKA